MHGVIESIFTGAVTQRFGAGGGFIFLDDVQCSGTETLLVHCQHRGANVHDCVHSNDAGVRCIGIVCTNNSAILAVINLVL